MININDLIGDATITGYRDFLKRKYKSELELGEKRSYKNWLEDTINELQSHLYEAKAYESGKAFVNSDIFKNMFKRVDK